MKSTKLVKKTSIKSVSKKIPKKVETPLNEDGPIYGINENSKWAKRLKKYNPSAYARLRDWD